MKPSEAEHDDDLDEETEASGESDADETADADAETDNVGDASVEINVEDLIHELEVEGLTKGFGNEQAARRRLEQLMEEKRARRDLEDFEDYDI